MGSVWRGGVEEGGGRGRRGRPPSGGRDNNLLVVIDGPWTKYPDELTSDLMLPTEPVSSTTSCVWWWGLEDWREDHSKVVWESDQSLDKIWSNLAS